MNSIAPARLVIVADDVVLKEFPDETVATLRRLFNEVFEGREDPLYARARLDHIVAVALSGNDQSRRGEEPPPKSASILDSARELGIRDTHDAETDR